MLAYIGLGSNLQQPENQIRQAVSALVAIPNCQLKAVSSLYGSPPMGPVDQPDYINAVAALETSLSADDLLTALQAIEQEQGRVRLRHWGERTLDLDILLYGDSIIQTERLTVPHPGMASRAFVLYPLYEIAPELVMPLLGDLANLIKQCPKDGLEKIDESVL